MFCKNCGKKLTQETKFCKFCGDKNKKNSLQQIGALPNPIKNNRDFIERDIVQESDSADKIKIKKQWNTFVTIFWILFAIKLITKGAESSQDESIMVGLFILQFPVYIGMVILMGYYSYKFSGKKSYWLFGLLGLLWIAVIGIFIGFWQVRRLKNERLGIKKKTKSFQLSK